MGVFVCQYAERVARRSPLNFRQKDLDRVGAREMIINELLEGRINPTWRMVNTDRVEETEGICKEVRKKATRSRHGAEKKCQKKQEDKSPASKKVSDLKEKQKENSEEATKGEEERKALVKWPKGNSNEWIKFDEDVTEILKVIHASHEKKAEIEQRIIYNIGKERCGVKEVKQKTQPSGPSKRQMKCNNLRKEIKKLTRAYKNAPEEEKAVEQLSKE